jgi:isopentenyldiphosphate isomerase
VDLILNRLYRKLPKFPDGRIDYHSSNIAVVVTVFIKYKNKILLLKRSNGVRTYKRKWNTVAGYIDRLVSAEDIALKEVDEELGIKKRDISALVSGNPYRFTDKKINKTWIICPFLLEVRKKPRIRLDWEHTEYKWIDPKSLMHFDTVPNLDRSLIAAKEPTHKHLLGSGI